MSQPKMTFHVESRRIDSHYSSAQCKAAEITLDTDLGGNRDAFNPAELLLAALSACIIKGIERACPILRITLTDVARSQGGRSPTGRPAEDGVHRL